MTALRDPQMGPAMALVQLIAEHPVRPETLWSINDGTLRGQVYGPHAGGRAAVTWYANMLGCEPVAKHAFQYAGQTLRVMALSTLWRDVPVLIEVSVPVVLEPTEVRLHDGTVLVPADVAVAS